METKPNETRGGELHLQQDYWKQRRGLYNYILI